MEELLTVLTEAVNTWPGATVRYRDDWTCDYFSVADKGFCLFGTNKEGQRVLTVKGVPEKNEVLREQYAFVVPGYYANKTHWNSIILEESTFTQAELIGQLKQSYELVVAKLSKKVQASL